jgi:hypothetical protein
VRLTTNGFYILVDAAQYPKIWKTLDAKYRNLAWLSLFEHTGNKEAIKVGPLLIEIEHEHEMVLNDFIEQTKNTYCLSWITSPLSLSELRDHLNALTNIEMEDGTSWVMRYFDTRILPIWYGLLNEDQKAHVSLPIVSWSYVDRLGAKQTINGVGHKEAPSEEVFKLSQQQENILFDAAYPDAIIQKIAEGGSDELQAMSPPQRYQFIAKQIQTANKQFGIEGTPDVLLFCTLALMNGDGFENSEPYAGMLRQVKENKMPLGDAFNRMGRN